MYHATLKSCRLRYSRASLKLPVAPKEASVSPACIKTKFVIFSNISFSKMASHPNHSSPTNSHHKIKTPSATVSRPGSSTPIVITSFAMKDVAEFQPDSIPMELIRPMEIDVILDKLKDCDAIKYAAYRTATKLDILRSGLRLDQVKLGAVNSAFHQHGY